MKRSHSSLALVGFGAAVAAAAWFGSRFSPKDARTRLWYKRLDKPGYNPPQYVFPIVWTSLYTLMAISGWRVWRAGDSDDRTHALRLWAGQLATNTKWTKYFFGEHRPKRALMDVILLESMVLGYIKAANEVDRVAALCFVPYAGWVAFATVLNADIVRRNPDAEEKLPHPRVA